MSICQNLNVIEVELLTLILPTNYFNNICTEIGHMQQQLKYLILQDSLCENSHNVSAYFGYDPNLP